MAKREKGDSLGSLIVAATILAVVLAVFRCPPSGKAATSSPQPRAESSSSAGGGYVLHFSKDFNPGAASVDDLGLSVLIAVDLSGSMLDPPASGGDPKYQQAGRALGSVVDFLQSLSAEKSMAGLELKVGVIGFSSSVREVFPLRAMDSSGFAALRSALAAPDALKPSGKTAIGLALQRGAEILAGSGTIMKSMVVISDGENTDGVEPERVLSAINENRNDASTEDYAVSTRGTLVSFIGYDVDAGLFGPLAAEGARIQSAGDQAGLEKALREIMVADISKLEASGN